MNRVFLHSENFRRIHSYTDELKMALRARKVSETRNGPLVRCNCSQNPWFVFYCHALCSLSQSTFVYRSLVILKLGLKLIATESPFAPNNYLSDPNQHIKSLPKSTRQKIVNLPEHFQLICIISKVMLVCLCFLEC